MADVKVQTLTDLVQKYGKLFPEVLVDAVEPVYNFELEKVFKPEELVKLRALGSQLPLRTVGKDGQISEWRGPLPGQQHVIAALCAALNEGTSRFILRGETGVGKTQIALMTLEMANDLGHDMFPALVTEPRRVTKQWRKRVKVIVPDAVTMTITKPIDAEIFAGMARVYRGKKKLFGFIPNSMISRGPGFRSVYRMVGFNWNKRDMNRHYVPLSIFSPLRDKIAVGCPVCYLPFVDVELPATRFRKDTLFHPDDLESMVKRGLRIFCPRCGSAMFEEVRPVPPGKTVEDRHVRFDVGEYIVKNWKRLSRTAGGNYANSLIIDELHKVFNMESIRGATVMNLSRKVKNVLGLGASIYSGKASSIFWIYFMFFPEAWRDWGPLDKAYQRWIEELSNEAIIEKTKIQKFGQGQSQQSKMVAGRSSKLKRELPSAPPRLVKMLAPKTVHIKLKNLGIELPPLSLHGLKVKLEDMHQQAYEDLMKDAIELARSTHNASIASSYLQAALTYPIAPWMPTEVGSVQALQFPPDYICNPEKELIKFCKDELSQGRKTIVYVTHTDIRDIVPRLIDILDNAGVKAVRMPKSIDREKIPEWLHNEAPKYDVCILQEKAVEGVDAVNFQNVIFYEVDYTVWPVQQAAGRHWRLGQTEPCKTVFMEIEKTMLHRALALVMQSMCASSQIYGDEVDAQVSKFNKGTLITEALRQEMQGADLPDMDDLYKKTHQVITEGVATNDTDGPEHKDEEPSGIAGAGFVLVRE